MITELTKQQESLMHLTRAEWINKAKKDKELDLNELKKQVNWLYDLSGLKAPEIVLMARSPIEAQIMSNLFETKDQVWRQVRRQVREQVEKQVKDQVWGQVGGQLWDQVREQVGDQVRGQSYRQVRYQVEKQVGEQVDFTYFPLACLGLSDFGWVSYYAFFKKIGILDNTNFNSYEDFVKNIYDCILFSNIAIVIEKPTKVFWDVNGKLHNENGPAVEFADGYSLYALCGVRFEKELYDKVVEGSMTFKEIMKMRNDEQRMVALKFRPPKKLIEELGEQAILLDENKKGYKLYKITGIFDVDAYFTVFSCPSTGRVYMDGIDPDFAKENEDVDSCMAWSLRLTKDEYLNDVVIET